MYEFCAVALFGFDNNMLMKCFKVKFFSFTLYALFGKIFRDMHRMRAGRGSSVGRARGFW